MLSTLIALSPLLTFSHAADYNAVGVKVGGTADYIFTSDDPGLNGAVAHEFIQKIEGTTVMINGTIRYTNGTVQGESISGDISAGQNSIYFFLICANLTNGDPIFNGSSMKITGTVSMSVLNTTREVNHMSRQYIIASLDIYWDQLTGLMIGVQGSGFGKSIDVSLTNTTVWPASYQPPGNPNNHGGTGAGGSLTPWLVAVPASVIVVVFATLLFVWRDRIVRRRSQE